MGENAGVVDVGDGWAVTFKIESHNHPCYIEPFQGAATGVGGIVRDIISMGARPVAVMDALRFGDIDDPDTARVLHGVVARHLVLRQLPRPAEHRRRARLRLLLPGNPLVNALASGVLRHEDLQPATRAGSATRSSCSASAPAADGIGGASILASDTFAPTGGPTKRPAVQVGDPFAEKVLIECCLELFQQDLVEGIQDLGAAGISCATSELAPAGDGGMFVELDSVLLRDPTLTPAEILMCEPGADDGHRHPRQVDAFMAVARSGTSRPRSSARSPTPVADHELARRGDRQCPAADRGRRPGLRPPGRLPAGLDALNADGRGAGPRRRTATRSASAAGAARHARPRRQALDHQPVRRLRARQHGAGFPDDGGMVRVDEETGLGFAVATDANGRYCQLDPYQGAQLALAEAYRNVAVTGARPVAVSDCLNFGSPGKPGGHVAVRRGRPRPRRRLPDARHPGHRRQRQPLQPDRRTADPPDAGDRRARRARRRRKRLPVGFAGRGRRDLPARHDRDGARRLGLGRGHPHSTWAATRRPSTSTPSGSWPTLIAAAASAGLLASAHDLSDGGLAIALAESCLRGGRGCWISLA